QERQQDRGQAAQAQARGRRRADPRRRLHARQLVSVLAGPLLRRAWRIDDGRALAVLTRAVALAAVHRVGATLQRADHVGAIRRLVGRHARCRVTALGGHTVGIDDAGLAAAIFTFTFTFT